MTTNLGCSEYRAKFAREALADGKAKGLSPYDLQPLVEEDREAQREYMHRAGAVIRSRS